MVSPKKLNLTMEMMVSFIPTVSTTTVQTQSLYLTKCIHFFLSKVLTRRADQKAQAKTTDHQKIYPETDQNKIS